MIDRLNAALEGRYRIDRKLGEGGMATVYLAEDLKHKRNVAIKVLRPELAAVVGAERFLSEIETTANLQHPHILPLFDSGQADNLLFYVMPYVEGESLRDRLDRRGEMPVDDAVELVTKVAAALQHAHDRGVVHRDIKPANILVQGGEPLVADFGIALAVSQAGGGRFTETGLSLGTPHYMSPEQAEGERDPDPRSDIYSLACLLYEMLTGEPPHQGRTAQAVLTKLLTAEVTPPARIRSSIPAHVDAAVLKGLAKLPADRFQEAKELASALADPGFTTSVGAAAGARTPPASAGWTRRSLPWLGIGGVAGLLAGALLWSALSEPPEQPTTRSVFAMPAGQEILDATAHALSFTPDGSALVFVGSGPGGPQLWVKERGSEGARPLPGTANAQAPETDPSGEWVAFQAGGEIRKAPLVGGPSVVVGDSAVGDIGSVAWLDDGTIAYTGVDFSIRQVSDEGGPGRILRTPPDPGVVTLSLSAVPGGNFLWVTCANLCRGESALHVWSASEEASRLLEPSVVAAWYVESGHVVMVRPGGSVFGARFDPDRLEFLSEPVPLFEGVQLDLAIMPDMEVGYSGQLLAQLGGGVSEIRGFFWVDRGGVRTPVDPEFSYGSQTFQAWRLSPDGSRVAFAQTTDGGDDVWVKELDTGPAYRLTFDDAGDYRPDWHPDGEQVLFVSERGGNRDLYQRRANATGPVELVLDRPREISQGVWSPDGEWLVYREGTGQGRDLWAWRPGVDSVPSPLIASPEYDEMAPALSPDGRWLAYESEESGQTEVYVRPFPAVNEGKWQISVGGGREPVWAHSGQELFYVRGDENLMAARVNPGPPFSVGAREVLFSVQGILLPGQDHASYDVHPDDQRFLLAIPVESEESGGVYWLMIDNWGTELRARLGG